jgi:hypothetical protein
VTGSLREELLAIRADYGQLTPANVVAAASAADHPLHSRFEWDDTVAASQYRLVQARELIRVVREHYVNDAGPASVRYFHAIPRPTGMVYEPAAVVAADEVGSRILLASMEREWRLLRQRYERFAEFRELVLRDLRGDAA